MARITSTFVLALLLFGGVTLSSCSKKSADVAGPVQTNAFDSASPELKSAWDKAMAAAQSKDYATAVLTFKNMQARQDLTPEQRQSVNNEMTTVNNQLTDALKNNDPAAQAALKKIRENWR